MDCPRAARCGRGHRHAHHHFYPQQWGKENDDTLLASVEVYRGLFRQLRQEVERVVGAKRAGEILFVNVGYNSVNHSPGPNTRARECPVGCGYARCDGRTGTDIACYWAVHNAFPLAMETTATFRRRGATHRVTRTTSFPCSVITSRASGKGILLRPFCCGYAAKSGKRLSVVLVNKDKMTSRNVSVSLKDFPARSQAAAWILDQHRRNEKLPDVKVYGKAISTTVPPFAFVVFEIFHRDSVFPPVNIAREASATASSYSSSDRILLLRVPSTAGRRRDGIPRRGRSRTAKKNSGSSCRGIILKKSRPFAFLWGESCAVRYVLEASDDANRGSR